MSPDVERKLALGRISFAGCMVTDRDPRWICNACGARFGLPGEAAPNFTVVDDDNVAQPMHAP
jgi:hypothetical protein